MTENETMPDRYDPKLSVRPPGERKTAEASSDSDPLAELARIVSGRAPFDAPPAAKGKAVAAPPAPEPDVERDLEAELLNDLQASFAAIREPLEDASSAVSASDPQPEPAPLPPRRAAAEPSPSRVPEPKPEPPPRRPEAMSFDISQAFEESEFAPAPKAVSRPQPAKSFIAPMRGPAAPQNRGDLPARVAPALPRPPPAARPDQAPAVRGEPVQPRLERPASPQAGPDKPSLLRRVVGPPRSERPNLPVRPLPGNEEPRATEPAAPPRAGAPKPGRAEPAPLPSRFAPPKAAIPPPRRQPAPEPVVEPPAEDDFELADLAGELEGPFEDEFTLDDLDAAAYGPDDEFPPFPEEELASLKRRRSGRVFAVVAGMFAVVAIGGAAVFLYRSDAGTGSPPPIIAADSGPNKVPPDEPAAAETDSQGKLIYDRVDESGDGSETRLVTSGEAEVGDIPSADADVADNPISRVIIPGGPGIDSPVSGDGAGEAVIAETDAAAPDTPAGEESDIGPRMVRTVVVKPDGTIVSSEATGVDEDGNALPQPEESDVAVSLPDPTRTQMDAVLEGGDLEVNLDPLSQPEPVEEPTAAAGTPAAGEPLPEPPSEPEVAPAMRTLPSPQPEPIEPAAAAPEPVAPPPARQEQTIVATRDSADGPIDLTPGTAPAAGAVQTGGGGVLVQVTAMRSEAEAVSAYRGLQQRYPSILGAFQPTIVRADLGERGIYYRVRVGPFSGGDATRLCEDLKAAGADCMIAR